MGEGLRPLPSGTRTPLFRRINLSVVTRDGLLLPSTHYVKTVRDVNRAVNEYDERLSFGWNEEGQDWVVFINLPNEDDFERKPILGFGSQLPEPHEAVKRIYQSDAKRHGDFIWNEMHRKNRELQKKQSDKTDAATSDAAEKVEFANRRFGVHDQKTFSLNRAQRRRAKVEFKPEG